jgi:hypothetical protein
MFPAMVQALRSDRRKGARYAMQIPIRVSDVGVGSTIDISASGVAFVIDVALEPGSVIDFAMKAEERAGAMELQCGGRVVRVERRGPSLFAAATIDNLAVARASVN